MIIYDTKTTHQDTWNQCNNDSLLRLCLSKLTIQGDNNQCYNPFLSAMYLPALQEQLGRNQRYNRSLYRLKLTSLKKQRSRNQCENEMLTALYLPALEWQVNFNQCDNKSLVNLELSALQMQFSYNQCDNDSLTALNLTSLEKQMGGGNQCNNLNLEYLIMPKLISTGVSDCVFVKKELYAPLADLSGWVIHASPNCDITCKGDPIVLRADWNYNLIAPITSIMDIYKVRELIHNQYECQKFADSFCNQK